MLTSDFNYHLPPELIAQEPPQQRGTSRMLVLQRNASELQHRQITALGEYLQPGDLLVLNDTRVFPARLLGQWQDTGGALELLLIEALENDAATEAAPTSALWHCLVRSGRRARPGQHALFGSGQLTAEFTAPLGNGVWSVRLESSLPLMDILEQYGLMPVPPYIKRLGDQRLTQLDRERYQTIYARSTGAVAAPTAGLHFTTGLLEGLKAQGIATTSITLHVGPGTFKPVKSATVAEHRMDAERFEITPQAAAAIAACKAGGGRVIAVGSTCVRTLESVAAQNSGSIVAASGRSQLFIYPPYRFQVVDAMLTNFHLPQSTLIMMVAALAGRDTILHAYSAAVRERYRFFSYGDCMLII